MTVGTMTIGTTHTNNAHTAIVINAAQILDTTICATNEELARLNEKIAELTTRRNRMLSTLHNGLEVQAGVSDKVVLSDSMRKEVIYEALHQAAQRNEGETMVVDLGFESTEDEKSYAMNMWHELEDPMFGNTFSIEKNLIAFSEYKN